MGEPIPLSVWPAAQQTSTVQRRGRYVPESMAHPAKMLPAIARAAIEAYTEVGDLVLDPMCGIGTTLVEAAHLGRRGLGIEYEPRWANLARANLALAAGQGAPGRGDVVTGDARRLDELARSVRGQVALVLTSPPYGDSVHGHVHTRRGGGVAKSNTSYSDDPTNLARAGLDGILDATLVILVAARELLRPGGIVALTARPWRRRGQLIDLPGAVVQVGEAAGLVAYERNIVLLAGLRNDKLVPRASFFQLDAVRKARLTGTRRCVIAHEDLLVFRRELTARGGQHRVLRAAR
jgi:SAM-dependent methyltransferase